MKTKSYFLHSIILASIGLAATTQSSVMTEKDETLILKMFPDKIFSVWVSTMGDINGDKIEDIVAILTAPSEVDQREEILVVLTGSIDHSYKLLSTTNGFCQARNFYNLKIEAHNLSVETVASATSSHIASTTMEFRYNKKINDLELISSSIASEDLDDDGNTESTESQYVNYLSMTKTQSRTQEGKNKEIRIKLQGDKELAKLQGFNCLHYDFRDNWMDIDDDSSKKNAEQ